MSVKDLCIYIVEAAKLDVDDVNYYISSDKLNSRAWGKDALPRKGICIRLLSFFNNFVKSISSIFSRKKNIANNTLFFVNNKNELLAIEPIFAKLTNADIAGYGLFYNNCPYFFAYLTSLLFIPIVFYKFIVAVGLKKENYTYAIDSYILSYGFYIMCKAWFKKVKPKSIVISNDLIFKNRVIIVVTKELKIPIYYIQHASVNNKFPPLTVDYALLDGYNSVKKYLECGPTSTKIFIIGIPKCDSSYDYISTSKVIANLGICTNNLDSFERIEELSDKIRSTLPSLTIYLRSHPSDRRINDFKKLASKMGIIFSDSRKVPSIDFLKSVDAIIGCDSNILLEAALMNVFPLCYDFSKNNLDWYEFVKTGLVEYYSEPQSLSDRLLCLQKNRPSIRDKAKLFSGTIGTSYDGHSSELAAMLIEDIDAFMTANDKWHRMNDSHPNVFELLQ